MDNTNVHTVLETTRAAIADLSNPSANQYLVELERSPIAWEVAEHLVSEPDNQCRFFGAKFLYSKIQKQYHQLSAINVQQLTQSLVGHILKLSQEANVEFNVCRYLCLALAALALQMNQSGILNQILAWLNPIIGVCPMVLLELLIVLPEESCNYKIDVPSKTRNHFINQLSDTAGDVLAFLSTLWPTARTDVQAKILLCAHKWIDTTNIESETVLSNNLYQFILQSLTSTDSDLFDSSVDTCIVIYQRFQCKDMQIINSSLPAIFSLRQRWSVITAKYAQVADANDVDEDDLNACRSICRLFTEVSESLINMFVDQQLIGINIGQSELVQQLLLCASFQLDADICRIPLKFFYELAMHVGIGMDSSTGSHSPVSSVDEAVPPPSPHGKGVGVDKENSNSLSNNHYHYQQSRIEINNRYLDVYQHLLEIAIAHTQLTNEVLGGSVSVSERKLDMRVDWKETILDCCHVLGSLRCIQILCAHLENSSCSINSGSGQGAFVDYSKVESCLFAIQHIACFLSKSENTYTPHILSFAANLPSSIPRLRATVTELFGRFAFWFAHNPSHLSPVVSELFKDLQQQQQQPNSIAPLTAATAIMHIFRVCCHIPGLPIKELYDLTNQLRASSSGLSLDAELLLLESIMLSLSHLPGDESEVGFKTVAIPIIARLSELVHQSVQAGRPVECSLFTPHIDRITVIFQHYRSERGLRFAIDLFMNLIPLFQQMLLVCCVERLCERICRCYKHALRNFTKEFGPFVPVMTAHLADQFAKTPFPAFLYAAAICISCFALTDSGIYVEALYQMVWSMSNSFFQLLNSLERFEEHPDLVEEYFFLMAKTLQYCPAPFVAAAGQQSSTVLSAAIVGLALKHREAQKGILLFFERFVQLSSFWSESSNSSSHGRSLDGGSSSSSAVNSSLNNAARLLIIEVSPSLLEALFGLLSGLRPAYAIDESNGCISDVMWYLRKRFTAEFKVLFHPHHCHHRVSTHIIVIVITTYLSFSLHSSAYAACLL